MNPLFGIAPRMQPGLIVSNGQVVPLDVFRRSEFYNGWARPQGLCCPITLVMYRTRGKYLPLTLVRPDGAGDASPQDRAVVSRFAPHLLQAMQVTLRLQMAEARHHQLGLALTALAEGAVLVDRRGQVVFANAAADAFLDGPATRSLSVVQGELVACDPASNTMLRAALAAALTKEGPPLGTSVTIRRLGGLGQMTLTITPLPHTSAWEAVVETDRAGRPSCLILISDGGISVLSRTYRLTPAETRLVEAVVTGKGLSWAARTLGIARSTAQSHLDNVFQKTGTNRQAELVSLTLNGRRAYHDGPSNHGRPEAERVRRP